MHPRRTSKKSGPPRSKLSISLAPRRLSRIPLERRSIQGISMPSSAVHTSDNFPNVYHPNNSSISLLAKFQASLPSTDPKEVNEGRLGLIVCSWLLINLSRDQGQSLQEAWSRQPRQGYLAAGVPHPQRCHRLQQSWAAVHHRRSRCLHTLFLPAALQCRCCQVDTSPPARPITCQNSHVFM